MSLLARVPLTIRHGIVIPEIRGITELDADGWDKLRASDTSFGFAAEEQQRTVIPRARAERVAEIAAEIGAKRLCSYGAGTGILERDLVELGCDVTATEFAPESVAGLNRVLPTVVQHDLRDGPLTGFDLHVLHRVDCELSNREWRRYFSLMTEPHLIVWSQFIGWTNLRRELSLQVKRQGVRAGWFRTEARVRMLVPGRKVDVFDLTGFLVTPSTP